MPRIRLKICGIASPAEARAAVAAGADAIGLDPAMFPSRGLAGNEALANIALALPPTVTPILLSHALTAGTIAQQVDASAATAVQVMRPLPTSEYPGLKRIIRGRKIIQSVPLHEAGASVREAGVIAAAYAEFADALHLAPEEAKDLPLCRQIVEEAGLPVFLRLASVEAMRQILTVLRPFAIDLVAPRIGGELDGDGIAGLTAWLG